VLVELLRLTPVERVLVMLLMLLVTAVKELVLELLAVLTEDCSVLMLVRVVARLVFTEAREVLIAATLVEMVVLELLRD
jgi:hypothetical protein